MKVVAYYRVSTTGQGRGGLGLDAQRSAVAAYCGSRRCEIVGEFTEIESGKVDRRPELTKAMHLAKVTGATLVVAKLDRLSRNVAFLAALQESGAPFVAADLPEANELTIHIMAAVAQAERKAISRRTKEALAMAKAKGVRLGNPNGAAALARAARGNSASLAAIKHGAERFALDVGPIIADLKANGHTSLRALATEMNRRGIVTRRGGEWHAATVRDLVQRLGALK
ncbi:MAG: recombinase family protein [Novosphingobium sp.]|uniref:recombinase family protein n=1 Tax=Novosphingobium sp. TaxID=1874826 RepID=UPI003B9A99D1